MNILLTTAGQAAVSASLPAPPVFTAFKLADAFNYLPSTSQTILNGSIHFVGVPSEAHIIGNNRLKYTLTLDPNVGPFQFGEVGLYLPGNILAAVGTSSALISKFNTSGSVTGNTIVIDFYVSTVGTNYSVYAELGNSNYPMNLQAVPGVDSLPAAAIAFPNIYMAASPDGVGSVIAHSNNALWSVSDYGEQVFSGTVNAATSLSVNASGVALAPAFPGELFLQFTSGANLGVCRIATGYNPVGFQYTLSSPLTVVPSIGDQFVVMKKSILRPSVSALLNGLDPALTSGMLNDLVLDPVSGLVKQDGSTPRTGVDNFGGFRATNLADPVNPTDVVNKQYADSAVSSVTGSVSSVLGTIATINANYVKKDGTVAMTGNFNLGGNKIGNLGAPSAVDEATNKAYVDTLVGSVGGSIVTTHNSLNGIQGGSPSERYHLNSAQYTYLTDFVTNGFPAASYINAGIVELADTTEAGNGVAGSVALTPESLLNAINSSTSNNLQSGMQNLVLGGSTIRFGSGAPNGATPISPKLYVDTFPSPRQLYVYDTGVWYPLTPVSSTSQLGMVRLATNAESSAMTSNSIAVTPSGLAAVFGAAPSYLTVASSQLSTIIDRQAIRYNSGNFAAAQATGANPSRLAIGFADTVNNRIVFSGVMGGFTGLVADAEYYLSASVGGAITNVPPADLVRVGVAQSATELFIDIDQSGGVSSTAAGITLDKTITQTAHGFSVGAFLYFTGSNYARARADASTTSEVVGIITSVIDANTFVITTNGYLTGFSGLTPGAVYFLSTSVSGGVQSSAPSINGHIEKPLMVAASSTDAWLNIMRGSAVGTTSGGSATTTQTQQSITQAGHGFIVGDWLYHTGIVYAKALASSAATSNVVGVVAAVINSSSFTLVSSGYVNGLSSLTAGSPMYLSVSAPGAVQSTKPTLNGQIEKAVIIADSSTSGWLTISSIDSTSAVTQGIGNNSTKVATTAFVMNQGGISVPLVGTGAGSAGVSTYYSREDHVHPASSGSGLGVGQTWQDVTGSRALGTTYYNLTGKPIFVSGGGASNGTGGVLTASVDSVSMGLQGTGALFSGTAYATFSFIVPPGSSYAITNSSSMNLQTWSELR